MNFEEHEPNDSDLIESFCYPKIWMILGSMLFGIASIAIIRVNIFLGLLCIFCTFYFWLITNPYNNWIKITREGFFYKDIRTRFKPRLIRWHLLDKFYVKERIRRRSGNPNRTEYHVAVKYNEGLGLEGLHHVLPQVSKIHQVVNNLNKYLKLN